MEYIESLRVIIEEESKGLDSIYEDFILKFVGTHGLNALLKAGYLEGCGSINNRQLYVFVDEKG